MLEDGSILDRHPVLDLLKNPNPYMVWSDFAGNMARHFDLTHMTHLYAMGVGTMPPQEIHPIKPISVSQETNGEYVSVYHIGSGVAAAQYNEFRTPNCISRYFDRTGLKELYRISGFSSMSTNGQADSPLQAAALETQQQIKGRVHNTTVLDSGGRLSLLIMFKDTGLSDDKMRARLKSLNESFAGADKAGKIGAFEGGDVQEVREMGQTPKEMDFAELDKMAGQAIYFRYNIPLALVSTQASTFNNLKTGIEMFYDLAVLPLADKMFAGLTRMLMPRYKIELGTARITYNPDSLQSLKERRLEELKKRKEIAVETINELREAMPNRGPVAGGDVIYQPATMIPIGTDINDSGFDTDET